MHIFVYVTLLFPLAAAPLARALTARADPRWATWLMTTAAVVLAGTSCGALGLLAAAALVRLPALAQLGDWSASVVASGDTTASGIALAAGTLFGAALLAMTAFAVRRARALADAFRHARDLPGDDSLVVTGDVTPDAYTIPGRPGRIVVSAGMLEALDARGRTALLAHERAHLTGRHYVFTSTSRLAAAANPLLRPLADAVEFAVERWADEHAAKAVGDRRLVAETIAHAAVASKSGGSRRTVSTVLGAVIGRSGGAGPVSLSGAGAVPRRVAAMLAPRQRGVVGLAVGVALLTVAAMCALHAADDLQDLLSLAHARDHTRFR
jgi:Peptidase family M48